VCVCVGVCIARHFFSLFCSDSSCFCVFLGEGGGRGGGAGGVQKHHKKLFNKKAMSRLKNIDHPLDLLSYFWMFLGKGSSKTANKGFPINIDIQPWYFFGLRGTNQPTTSRSVILFL
jgi:hypothetical protein